MSSAEVYLYGHLLGVFILVGAAGLSTGAGIALPRSASARTVVMLTKMIRYSELIGTSTGIVLVLIFGFALVGELDYSMGDPWISATFALIIVVLGLDHGYLLRQARKAHDMAEALGDKPVSEELKAQLNNPMTAAVGMLLDVSLLVFLWLMIAKPGA
ncbi:MAG: DUF2269 family protein [Dehalococcoidia bacterium]|nr:DUF2269 family protein [Dehalococcoidia bacterium]